MKSNILHSFRAEILLYALTSMLLSFLTVGMIFGGTIFVQKIIEDKNRIEMEKDLEKEMEMAAANHSFAPMTESMQEFLQEEEETPARFHLNKPKSIVNGWVVVAVILVLVFFAFYFLLFTERFTKYLEEIADGIEEISAGNFDVEFSIRHEDELSTIAEGLNKMTADIKFMMEKERNSEFAKNELITNVAHDLRTPLTSIIGYLGLVTNNRKLTDEMKDQYIRIAYDKSRRLERLIEDLFSYTKVSFGQMTPRKSTVDMVKLTEQLLDEFYPSIRAAELDTRFLCREKQILMEVDGDLMARAIANLISNAIKYGRDGKTLQVELLRTEHATKLMVTNFGKMIPPEDLEHIFDRFYRVEGSRSTDTGGTGLGLAITRNVVRMHNGTIKVRSDHMGTVFTITLFDRVSDNPEAPGSEKDEESKTETDIKTV